MRETLIPQDDGSCLPRMESQMSVRVSSLQLRTAPRGPVAVTNVRQTASAVGVYARTLCLGVQQRHVFTRHRAVHDLFRFEGDAEALEQELAQVLFRQRRGEEQLHEQGEGWPLTTNNETTPTRRTM